MVFGDLAQGAVYSMRPGAYAVLTDSRSRVAIVEVSGRWLLPGGGIHAAESAEDALRRELLEELGVEPLGASVSVSATEFVKSWSTEEWHIIDGRYFRVTDYRETGEARQPGHHVAWVDPQEASARLGRQGQAWALKQLLAGHGEVVQASGTDIPAGFGAPAQPPPGFWASVDRLATECELVLDRPRGSVHPRFPELRYPLDYGFLRNTRSSDGRELDVWAGSLPDRRCVGLICTVDLLKRDSEVKLLLGCTPEEMSLAMKMHNGGPMRGLLMTR